MTALGLYDDDSDGLLQSHPTAIWEATTGALVASAVVPAGTTAALRDGFRFQAVAPARLLAGHAYVIAAHYVQDATTGDEDTVVRYGYTPITADNHITLDTTTGRFEFADDFGMPPAAVLLGVGVLGLCGYGWRRKVAAVTGG